MPLFGLRRYKIINLRVQLNRRLVSKVMGGSSQANSREPVFHATPGLPADLVDTNTTLGPT